MDHQNQAVLMFPYESRPSWILLLICRRPHENVLAAWCCCLSWVSPILRCLMAPSLKWVCRCRCSVRNNNNRHLLPESSGRVAIIIIIRLFSRKAPEGMFVIIIITIIINNNKINSARPSLINNNKSTSFLREGCC